MKLLAAVDATLGESQLAESDICILRRFSWLYRVRLLYYEKRLAEVELKYQNNFELLLKDFYILDDLLIWYCT